MPRGRGGKRQGTPGKAYANRTDMGVNYDMQAGSPAAGGIEAPKRQQPILPIYPEDTPNLTDPTSRPNEPLTSGMTLGAGPGPEALAGFDPRVNETKDLKKWLPILDPIADDPDTPDSVRTLVRYIRGA